MNISSYGATVEDAVASLEKFAEVLRQLPGITVHGPDIRGKVRWAVYWFENEGLDSHIRFFKWHFQAVRFISRGKTKALPFGEGIIRRN